VHPDIAPIVRCEPGDEVVLETATRSTGEVATDAPLPVLAEDVPNTCQGW
jgi:hypothetical protein